MLLPEPNPDELRQGDLCTIEFFPCWDLRLTRSLTRKAVVEELSLPTVPGLVDRDGRKLVAVSSQCCDIVNPNKRSGLAIAPVRKVPAGPNESDRRAEILASQRPDAVGMFSWIHLFPLLLPTEADPQLVVVDWSLLLSVGPHGEAVDMLTAGKVHQMADPTRDAFRVKLAAFFGRPVLDDAEPPGHDG